MKKILHIILLFGIHGLSLPGLAQQGKADSLRKLLKANSIDSIKAQLLLQLGECYETSQPDTALNYYQQAKDLSEKINYRKGLADYCSYSIVVLNNLGRYKEALELCVQTQRMYEGSSDWNELATCLINTGSEWQYLSDLQSASSNYLRAAQLLEKTGNRRLQRVANNNLASVFLTLGQFDKAKKYALLALEIARNMKDDYAIGSCTINIANAEFNLKQYQASIGHYQTVEMIGKKISDITLEMDGWLGLADNYKAMGRFDEAVRLYQQLIATAVEQQTPEYEIYGQLGIAGAFIQTKRFAEATSSINRGSQLSEQLGMQLELRDFYQKAADLYEASGDHSKALEFFKKMVVLNDSLLNEKNRNNINLQEIKFDTEKKAAQIKALEAERTLQAFRIRQKNISTYVLAGTALSLFLIALLSYRNYRNKQHIQQQRINELEKEKQLLATEAVLQGQEEERNRLAKDLHDGLGGMLSGIKYSFGNMKENLVMTPENQLAFERGIDMLDSSISELRRVAHSMMPEALLNFGLDAALKDFCLSINNSGVLNVVYQSHDLGELAISQTASVTIYRIVQELINNSIKHASASQVLVQLNKDGEKLLLTVEDDGKGFDVEATQSGKGIGWNNIRQRVHYLKGQLDLQSEKGKGMAVNIEIPV